MRIYATVDVSALRRLARNWDNTRSKFQAACLRDMEDGRNFIINVKLALPGPAVIYGGTPGPVPGGRDEPVLHVEKGWLSGSIAPPEILSSTVNGFEMAFGVEPGIRYAWVHEYEEWAQAAGVKGARPYMGPGAEVIGEHIGGTVTRFFK